MALKKKSGGGGGGGSGALLARDVLKVITLTTILLVLVSALVLFGDSDGTAAMSERKAALMKRLQESQRELVRHFEEETAMSSITVHEYQIFRDFLSKIDAIAYMNRYSYYLSGNSLLGCVRHKSIIPWEDNVQLHINAKDKEAFFRELKKETGFHFRHLPTFSRLFSRLNFSVSHPDEGFNWPSINIMEFHEDRDTDTVTQTDDGIKIHSEFVFPTKSLSFLGLQVQVPADPANYLMTTHGAGFLKHCEIKPFIYKFREAREQDRQKEIDCSILRHSFRFYNQF